MQKLIILIKNVLMLNDNTSPNIGLSQFKNQVSPVKIERSITNKDIRLSELMRRY